MTGSTGQVHINNWYLKLDAEGQNEVAHCFYYLCAELKYSKELRLSLTRCVELFEDNSDPSFNKRNTNWDMMGGSGVSTRKKQY
jgi:hypothetical protein